MSDNIKNTEFEIFPWQKNFDTGIEIIDNQHKKLVDILNLLASNLANRSKAVVLNKIFDELAEYANFHFESEEKVWVEYFKDDIWYQQHEKTHEKFIQQVLNLKKQGDKLELDTVIQNIVSFLTQWLTYHILDTDKRMAIVVQELKAGKPLAEAKKIADKKMSGSMQVLINTILKMYDTLSNRTMGFLRERALRLQAEAELMQSEERWKFILEGGVEGVWDWSIPENKISQSQDSETIFDRINESSSSKLSSTNIHPDDLLQMKQDFDDHLNGKTEFYSNKHRVLRNDICYWVLSRGKIVARDHEGQPTRMIGVNQDITEHQLASLIYQKSRQGMMIVSANEIIVSVNPAFSEMSGYKDSELIGNNPIHYLTTERDETFYYDMWKTVRLKGKWQGIIWNQRKDETKFPQEIEISNIKDKNGNANYYLLLINDVTEKIKSDKKIFYQANYDYLTGIANRYLFQQNLEQEISNSQQNNKSFALLLIDLDNFKDINDIKGHNFGDQLLKNVAKKINKSVKNKNNIARFGGDEFTVIIPETDNHSQTEKIAQEIISSLRQPFTINDEQVFITASIGIATYPNDGDDVFTILKHADQAMFKAKEQGRNRYSYFTHSMQIEATNRQQIAMELRQAIKNRELEIYYQPIVNSETGKIHKAEALLRWNHPTEGIVKPEKFIQIAEDTGLILKIGQWTFKKVCKQLKKWIPNYGENFQISINKSPKQFINRSAYLKWLKRLKKNNLSGKNIAIEITEGLLLDNNEKIQKHLLMFRDAGVDISIDDFGTGYSSLSYLKKFDIDFIKIDRSFISNLENEPDNIALIEAIIVMSKKLGIKTIAEGVETQYQNDVLTKSGCNYIQGYYYSKPIPVKEFDKLVTRHNEQL